VHGRKTVLHWDAAEFVSELHIFGSRATYSHASPPSSRTHRRPDVVSTTVPPPSRHANRSSVPRFALFSPLHTHAPTLANTPPTMPNVTSTNCQIVARDSAFARTCSVFSCSMRNSWLRSAVIHSSL